MAFQRALQTGPTDGDICVDDGYGDAADIAEVEALIHAPAVLPPPVLLQDAEVCYPPFPPISMLRVRSN